MEMLLYAYLAKLLLSLGPSLPAPRGNPHVGCTGCELNSNLFHNKRNYESHYRSQSECSHARARCSVPIVRLPRSGHGVSNSLDAPGIGWCIEPASSSKVIDTHIVAIFGRT